MAQHVRPSGARPVKMSAWTALPGSSALRKIIVPACFLHAVAAKTCMSHLEQEMPANSSDLLNITSWKHYYYHCPGIYHPPDYTECCGPEASKCCPPDRWFYEIDNTLATAIAVSVTLTCFALTLLVIVCCFWPRCPLYNACRSRYNHDIPHHKSQEFVMETMPTESPGNKKKYAPLASTNGSPTLDGNVKTPSQRATAV
ncbi:uncharacterized protein LOC120849601 isoform X2 [Ixodes scapularis]|uniref:uncharacterized protein LOC120849601 isoform X2 n=1 Tax=Ixodes scapularis TaxID=6945 RepID=UPI001A9EC73D|nr:uncharacterized protein LOC120849601 isoform X2 [Ixodes scapularis]